MSRSALPRELADKIEELALVPLFYYTTTTDCSNNIPRKTSVCLLYGPLQQRVYARGVAVCSERDNFCRRYGRTLAAARAYRCVVGNGEYHHTLTTSLWPCLNDFELRLVTRFAEAKVKNEGQ